MSVMTGALGSIAPKLLQLLHDEYKLQEGVRKQVKWLSDELESVYAFLKKVADVPWDRVDEQLKVWARQVREASYNMEDVLDTFLVRVDSNVPPNPNNLKLAMKKMGKVFSKAKARRDTSGAIKEIKKHLKDVAERRQRYKLDDNLSKPLATKSAIDPRLKAMYKEVTQLIGINKSRDELISMLMPSEPDNDASDKNIIKKVSIVGVGGLGKTTLAKQVYDKLKSQYDCFAFVTVGRHVDIKKVFKDILFNLDKYKYENIHNTGRGSHLLIQELREFLEHMRYFVVVDDVWEVETWNSIKLALPENNHGSKVITTTRKFDVAKEAGEVYKLQPLSYENSMMLFYTRIFGGDRNYHENQPDEISEKILKKCDGIPLAIITMTSLLVDKPKDEWSDVYNSIGFIDNKDNKDLEDIMMILSFSYYDMPSDLRTCLLYLSTYPEDYFIDKYSLIRKWIAEGFVDGKQGTRLFEVGERYFNDLINRSMIQALEDQRDGRVLGCRVHDMVLDLIRKFSFEENFISRLDGNFEGTSLPTVVRRLADQNRTTKLIIKMPKVRSYIAFWCYNIEWVEFLSFKLLRVLDIVECSFKEGFHLDYLGHLVHLRYLGLNTYDDIPELPEQIGDLKLLQTLDVTGRSRLPVSIVLLTQLVCLRADTSLPYGIRELTSLEELRIVYRDSDKKPDRFVKELGNLGELRVLEFSNDFRMDEGMQIDFVESLQNLQKIQHVEVLGTYWDADTAMWEAAGFVLPRSLHYFFMTTNFSKIPSCINPSRLPNLAFLVMHVSDMDEQDLKLLALLPALCSLELHTRSTVKASNINAIDGFFLKLRYFKINAIVQFEQPNEEHSSISLHIWNGKDALPFGSRKSSTCSEVMPSAVMPNLEIIDFEVYLKALMVNKGDCGNLGLQYLPCLQIIMVSINCYGVSTAEGDAALAALRNACDVHPNHPTLNMYRYPETQENEQEEAASQTTNVDVGNPSLASTSTQIQT